MKRRIIALLGVMMLVVLTITSMKFLTQEEDKIKLKIRVKEDGQVVKTIEKTYNSWEELREDAELKEFGIEISDLGEGYGFFKKGDGDREIEITIESGDEHEGVRIFEFKNQFDDLDGKLDFHFKDGDGISIEIDRDDEGNVIIKRNGEVISEEDLQEEMGDINIWFDDKWIEDIEDLHLDLFDEDNEGNFWLFDDEEGDGEKKRKIIIHPFGEHLEMDMEELRERMKELHEQWEETIDIDSDGNRFSIRIRHKATISDFEEGDDTLERLNLDSRDLQYEELSYYPNPSNGRFTLKFMGNDDPLEIRVVDMSGREVYKESVPDFDGTYNRKLDLSGRDEGMYVLQVRQGNRAVSKKLVIE